MFMAVAYPTSHDDFEDRYESTDSEPTAPKEELDLEAHDIEEINSVGGLPAIDIKLGEDERYELRMRYRDQRADKIRVNDTETKATYSSSTDLERVQKNEESIGEILEGKTVPRIY